MPLPTILHFLATGRPSWMPDNWTLAKYGTAIAAVVATKWYSSGKLNTAERNMHGRVVMMTGGTSGIGAATAFELARRGAQIVLLTQHAPTDPFLVEFIDDLRERAGHQMIYAEQVDLASLYSIRQFATKWIDNAPPRRLDMMVLCAANLTPPGHSRNETEEGIESTWMVNFLANFHLLGILSPALRAQPFDRDVRVIIPVCSSYIASPTLDAPLDEKAWSPSRAYGRSKLAMLVFGHAFQQHLEAYKRPDGLPMNTRVVFADPGTARTPGTRRWLTRGSVFGLLLYMLFYWIPWLLLKSPFMGAQALLHAAFEGSLGRDPGGRFIKECIEVDFARQDVRDEEVAKRLWEASDKLIETKEQEAALRRAQAKKEEEKQRKAEAEAKKAEDIEALVGAIKKGKEKEKRKDKEDAKVKQLETRRRSRLAKKAVASSV